MTMKNEKKSGYGARNSTFIGKFCRKKCDMRLSSNESRYTLRPRATLDVPTNVTNQNEFAHVKLRLYIYRISNKDNGYQ